MNRTPLVNLEVEQSVIGAGMLDARRLDRIAEVISTTDFSEPAHRAIWRVMLDLQARNRPLDLVTVSEQLEEVGHLGEVGGLSYLAQITANTPSASNAMAYAEIVADLANRRRLLGELGQVEALTHDKGTPFAEVVDAAQGRIAGLLRADAGAIGPIGQFLDAELITPLEQRQSGEFEAMGLSFGVPDLDELTLGMHPGQLVVYGARPSMGKTAASLTALMECVVKKQRPAVMFSMEMPRASLLQRLTAQLGDIPIRALRNPQEHLLDEHYPRLTYAVHTLKNAPLVIDDRAALTPSQIRGSAKRWRDYYGDLGLVVVDYLGLMRPDNRHGTREQEVAEMSGAMKALAKELNVPVLLLSQLNRKLEDRTDKRPMLSDLRESGSVEQDADMVVFLYRHERYYPDDERTRGVMEMIVAKQREGELGTVYAAARLANARIQALDAVTINALRNPPPQEPKRRPRSAMEAI